MTQPNFTTRATQAAENFKAVIATLEDGGEKTSALVYVDEALQSALEFAKLPAKESAGA